MTTAACHACPSQAAPQLVVLEAAPRALDATPDLAGYDWIVVSSSAGKDSQAQLSAIVAECDRQGVARDRIVVVHADLGERIEWAGTADLAREQAQAYGLRFEIVRRAATGKNRKAGEPIRDLLDEVLDRGAWMSHAVRFCTSYYKRDSIAKLYTRLANETHGNARESKKNPSKVGRQVRILEAIGLRAEESDARAKADPFEANKRQTNGRRAVDTWLPIQSWTTADVWTEIKRSGLRHHQAYDAGMPRLSCMFCPLASRSATKRAAELNPEPFAVFVEAETELRDAGVPMPNFTADYSLAEIAAEIAAGVRDEIVEDWQAA